MPEMIAFHIEIMLLTNYLERADDVPQFFWVPHYMEQLLEQQGTEQEVRCSHCQQSFDHDRHLPKLALSVVRTDEPDRITGCVMCVQCSKIPIVAGKIDQDILMTMFQTICTNMLNDPTKTLYVNGLTEGGFPFMDPASTAKH